MTAATASSPPRRLFRRVLSRRWLILGLLLVGLGVTVAGVTGQTSEIDSGFLIVSTAAGVMLAWVLGGTRVRARTGALISLGAALAGVFGRVGRLDGHVVALLKALAWAWWNVVRHVLGVGEEGALTEVVAPLLAPALAALQGLAADALALLQRMADWLERVVSGRPTFDPVSATIVWSLILWAVAAWAGWLLSRRGRALPALVPSAALLGFVFAAGDSGLSEVLTLLAVMLLLLAITTYDSKVRSWERTGVGYPDVRADLAAVSIGLTVALVAVSAGIASVDIERIREALERRTEENGTAAGSGPGSGGSDGSGATAGVSGLQRTHYLGPGPDYQDEAVLRVWFRTTEVGVPSAHHYLRAVTYDTYVGAGWMTSDVGVVDYGAGERIEVEPPTSSRLVRQEVDLLADLDEALFAAGDLLTVDQQYQVLWRSNEDQFGTATDAASYVAESFVSDASMQELRAAGEDYPRWVVDRYLSLPAGLPDRVLVLARDLTATEPTPYDRVMAIEDYLREYEYSLDVPRPPLHQDVVDYFLFELRRGFCDYYSSAMAVLARAAGVPARVALGYTSGVFNRTTGAFLVQDRNAHSWVEIYFPGYGWVEFEPTAAMERIDRADSELPAGPDDQDDGAPGSNPLALLLDALRLELVGPVALGLVLFSGVAWVVADEIRLRRGRPAVAAATLYRRVRRLARRLSVPAGAGDTAYEFGGAFARWAAERKARVLGPLLEPVAEAVDDVIRFYVEASYAPKPPAASERRQALRAWRTARWRLALARIGVRGS
jgi:transglutaminase-like putative cysteine protease